MPRRMIYKNMLLPLDGSEEAEKRVDEAASLVKLTNGELILFRVVDVSPFRGQDIDEEFRIRKGRYEKYLNGIKTRIESEGVRVKIVIVPGKPADEICKYAARDEVDIVLVSPHGAGGILGMTLGSVAYKVARQSSKPVLVIRHAIE